MNETVQNSKAEKALELIKKIDDKVIIFTEYRARLNYISNGTSSRMEFLLFLSEAVFLSAERKTGCVNYSEKNIQVLIATEAGGEGIAPSVLPSLD